MYDEVGGSRHSGGQVLDNPQPGCFGACNFCALAFHQAGWSRPAARTPSSRKPPILRASPI